MMKATFEAHGATRACARLAQDGILTALRAGRGAEARLAFLRLSAPEQIALLAALDAGSATELLRKLPPHLLAELSPAMPQPLRRRIGRCLPEHRRSAVQELTRMRSRHCALAA